MHYKHDSTEKFFLQEVVCNRGLKAKILLFVIDELWRDKLRASRWSIRINSDVLTNKTGHKHQAILGEASMNVLLQIWP